MRLRGAVPGLFFYEGKLPMPETANQNDIYQVRIVGRLDGQETNNVLHFRYLSGASDTDVLLHLIQVLFECFQTHLLPVLSASFTLEKIIWKRVGPTLGPEIITVATGTTVGGGLAAALPSFNSAVLSIRTNTGGRSHRGRMFIPGIPENQTINSTFDPALPFWLGLVAFCLCLVENFVPGDPVGSNSWGLSVYSRKLGGSSFPYGLSGITQMREIVPVSFIGTTRSRKVGRGS